MTVKRRDFQKAAALIHEFLLKLSEDVECAELRDALNLALLHMQRYYRLLRNRVHNQDKNITGGMLGQSLRGLSPMTPFKDAPDKFQWKWVNLDNPKLTLTAEFSKEFSTLPEIIQAAKVGDNDQLMELIDQDPDAVLELDGIGRNSMMYAVHFNHQDTVSILLEQGIDVNTKANDDSTAVHRACHDGNHEALAILINYGAVLNTEDVHGRSPIHWACANPNRECLRMLIEQGVSVNVRDKEGMSPSMWACRMDHIEHFELLSSVENQHIPEEDGMERDISSRTWMHHSVRRTEPLECLRTLLTQDSATMQDEDGKTVMCLAADQGSLAACKVIIEIAGRECIEDRDNLNRTPLILAALGGHGEVINYLLAEGADLDKVDNFGATVWDYARNRQLHYCMLIIASYIRQQARAAGSGGSVGEGGEEGDMPGEKELGYTIDPGLGINSLTINHDQGDNHMYYNHGNKPITAPHPPSQPPSTPRTRGANGTPRTPRPKTPATPRGSQNGPVPVPRGQHPITQALEPPTPRGVGGHGGKKRSPTTPVDDPSEEDMFFERHERDGSAGSKRMRSDDEHSPERDMMMSVMSVESIEHDSRQPSTSPKHKRSPSPHVPNQGHEEPEMQNDSEYIENPDNDAEEDERTVSIDAMDVSDFDGDNEDGGDSPSPRPPPPPRSNKRAPPPPQFHPRPPAPQQAYASPPPNTPREPPPGQYRPSNQEYIEGPEDGEVFGVSGEEEEYSSPPPQPAPRSPDRHTAASPFSPGSSTSKRLPPLGSLSPPPLASKDSLFTTHKDSSIPSTTRPASASKKTLAPLQANGRVVPPAHLVPLETNPPKRKKKKKKKDRIQNQLHQESLSDFSQPVPPPRGYNLPQGGQGLPPPTPTRREQSPPRGMQGQAPPANGGYQGSQSPGQYPQQGPRQPPLKAPLKKRGNPHEQEHSYALDQQLNVNPPPGANTKPPPSPRAPPLPQAHPRLQKLPPPSGRPKKHSQGGDSHFDDNRNSQEYEEDYDPGPQSRSRSGQQGSAGVKGQRFPRPVQNGNVQNGPVQNLRGYNQQQNGPHIKRSASSGAQGRKPPPSPSSSDQQPASPGRRPGSGKKVKVPPAPWTQPRTTPNGRLPPSVNN